MDLHIVILAAGQGSRMKSAKPKVLQNLCGQAMLFHVLDSAAKLKPDKVHIVYGFMGDAVKAAVESDWRASAARAVDLNHPSQVARSAVDINWVLQAKQGGTGDALKHAMPDIPDHAQVLVLYGDAPALSDQTLQKLIGERQFCGLVATVPEPMNLGRIKLQIGNGQSEIAAIIEAKDADPETLAIKVVNTGVVWSKAELLRNYLSRLQPNNAQGEWYLTDIFAMAAAENQAAKAIFCVDAYEGFGANDAWELAQLERYLQARRVKHFCVQGLRVADPRRVEIRGDLRIGQDVEFDINVIVEGRVSLGDQVQIGAFTRLKNCQLAAGTVVHSHCDLEGVTTLGACQIGPFARLRADTELSAGTRIGNFVETKKIKLGPGSKANHLSYLGDATIGAQVNIGAGVITCNYDGINKHQTIIEDGVFVGSNANLVAPIVIGKEATIGAGSTLSRDVPAEKLTLERGKAMTVSGWQRPRKK